jgi:hypothetical protein
MSASPANPLSEHTATSRQRRLKAAALSEVNQGILGVARDSIDEEQEWEFFCECGREDCHEHVSLTVEAYASLHDANGAVLAPGHRRSQLERARRLCEEAEALKRQAEHQLKRALRNLGSGGSMP